jgi:hypothetical protein
LIVLVLLAAAAAGAGATDENPAVRLLLSRQDVGSAYSLNRGITHRWTLAERTAGLSAAVKRELVAKWVAGAQTGFDGNDAVSRQAILSTADVFRGANVSRLVKAWQTIYLRNGRGARLAIPPNAPSGTSRFLMRGRMLSNGTTLEVILFLWQHDKALLSVWIVGRPGIPRVQDLMLLARRQDARATSLRA